MEHRQVWPKTRKKKFPPRVEQRKPCAVPWYGWGDWGVTEESSITQSSGVGTRDEAEKPHGATFLPRQGALCSDPSLPVRIPVQHISQGHYHLLYYLSGPILSYKHLF